jgi:acetylornithine deacetylase
LEIRTDDLIQLLTRLVSTPSTSGDEAASALLLTGFFRKNSMPSERIKNNLILKNKLFDHGKKTLILNTHHDTVKPASTWKRNPFSGEIENNRVYGLGSSDAGGPLVALIGTFAEFFDRKDLTMNIILVISAEEEISGSNGISMVLPALPEISFGIVGEPTAMEMAVAEKGLMVLDCISHGIAGHAARQEGENAIYNAINDIDWFRTYSFPEVSKMLGPVKMSVTIVNAGTQHNMIPDKCRFSVDIRSTDAYTHEDLLAIIRSNVKCEVKPRSVRLRPSGISPDHPLVTAGEKLGLKRVGSPALSDQALMTFPTVKIGPGDPNHSHMADENIGIDEIMKGIEIYKKLLSLIIL